MVKASKSVIAAISLTMLTPLYGRCEETCRQVKPDDGAYPWNEHSYYCGGTTQAEGLTMASAVTSSQVIINELRGKVVFYLFDSPEQYAAKFPAGANPQPQPDAFGVTKYDSCRSPVFIAIFMQNSRGEANTKLKSTTSLQIADAADYLLGYISNGGIAKPVNTRFSDSKYFQWLVCCDRQNHKQNILDDKLVFRDVLSKLIGGGNLPGNWPKTVSHLHYIIKYDRLPTPKESEMLNSY